MMLPNYDATFLVNLFSEGFYNTPWRHHVEERVYLAWTLSRIRPGVPPYSFYLLSLGSPVLHKSSQFKATFLHVRRSRRTSFQESGVLLTDIPWCVHLRRLTPTKQRSAVSERWADGWVSADLRKFSSWPENLRRYRSLPLQRYADYEVPLYQCILLLFWIFNAPWWEKWTLFNVWL